MDIIESILDAVDGLLSPGAAIGQAKPTQKRTGARVDHAIYRNTPRHDIYMVCGVCIPAPRYLNITGSDGTWNVPWLREVGIKVLDFDWGGLGTGGQLMPAHTVTDTWNPEAKNRTRVLAQWVRITVRGDNHVPEWAEMVCMQYEQKVGKAKYYKRKSGIINPRNWSYAKNARGVPIPQQMTQADCETMTPPDV